MKERFYFIEEGEILLILSQLEETVQDLKEILDSKNLAFKESEINSVEIQFSINDLEH